MNKKGFTLVEVIVSIALVLLLSTFVLSNMFSVDQNVKQQDYENLVKEILLAAEDYASSQGEVLNNIYNQASVNDCTCSKTNYVLANTLVDNGYIRGNNKTKDKLIDPRNNEEIGSSYYVTFCHKDNKLLTTFCKS